MTAVSPMTMPVPWSMQNGAADRGAGMDVDAGPRVGHLGQQARQDRARPARGRVGDAMDRDGQEARVRQDDLVHALGRGVAGADRVGVEDEPGVDLGQRLREGVHDPRRVGLPGERCHETAQVAAGEDQVGGQLVRAGGGVVGELREQDAEEPVRERGDVALERIEAAVLGAPGGEELRELVLAVVVGGRGHGLLRISGRCSGWAPGRRAGEPVGAPEEPRDERRDPPAQDVEAATDADAGGREEDLERRHRAHEEPAERRGAEGEGDRAEADEGGAERLGEPRRVLVLELGRRAEAEGAADRRPRAPGQEEAGAERGRDGEVQPDEERQRGGRREVRDGQDGGRDAGAEALAAWVDLAGGRGKDGHGRPPGTRDGGTRVAARVVARPATVGDARPARGGRRSASDRDRALRRLSPGTGATGAAAEAGVAGAMAKS